MVDLLSLVYGGLVTIGTLILLKVIDILLEAWINKTFFRRIWTWASKSFKKFITRFKPIKIRFQFRVQISPEKPTKVKEKVARIINYVAESYGEQIEFSPLTWNDADNMCSLKAKYNKQEYGINIFISTEYQDFDLEPEVFEPSIEKETVISDSIAFLIETNFPFYALDRTLLSLSALTSLLKEGLKETFIDIKFSKGMFVIAPIKGDFTIDHWIKEKRFEVSLLLKAQEKIFVNLYPDRAEIIFPTLQIDDKVYEYLKGTLLNYYL